MINVKVTAICFTVAVVNLTIVPAVHGHGQISNVTAKAIPDFLGISGSRQHSPRGSDCMDRDQFRNMKSTMDFYKKILEEKQYDLVHGFLSENVAFHTMEVYGRDEFKQILENVFSKYTSIFDIKNVGAEGNLVWTQMHVEHSSSGIIFPIFGAVHLLRFDCDGLISDNWEVSSDID